MNQRLDREEKQRLKQEQQEKEEKREARLLNAFNRTFQSGDGKIVLRYLMEKCGYQRPSTNLDPQSREINVMATVHDDAIRGIYLDVRNKIKSEILKDVEFDDILERELSDETGTNRPE